MDKKKVTRITAEVEFKDTEYEIWVEPARDNDPAPWQIEYFNTDTDNQSAFYYEDADTIYGALAAAVMMLPDRLT